MKVSFEGAGELLLSFVNNGAEAGSLVKLSADKTVSKCSSGERFAGICLHADEKHADVLVKGYAECAYTGTTAPALGFAKLSADTDGKVKADTNGTEYLVLSVDSGSKTVGFIM